MTRNLVLRVLSACLCLATAAVGPVHGELTVSGETLATLELPAPEDKPSRNYLGLSEGEAFTVAQVKAKLLIIEIFSMYCPLCQADAPHVNELFRLIEKDPALKAAVRILGIGTGNTPFEVGVFRDKYKTPFPLIPDETFLVQKACSENIRTPVFLLVRPEHGKTVRVLTTSVGKMESAPEFLKTVTKFVANNGGK